MPINYDFSEIRSLMDAQGVSMRNLAEATDIPVATLSDKFNCRTEFKISEMQAIANALGFKDVKRYFFKQKVR
ncbi:MAG: helix-turn-helix transcriptional regulator [Eubacteriales bacterium]|nr:helix-turn-helix transcriptional regulator [Eubacteriales bacterium]